MDLTFLTYTRGVRRRLKEVEGVGRSSIRRGRARRWQRDMGCMFDMLVKGVDIREVDAQV